VPGGSNDQARNSEALAAIDAGAAKVIREGWPDAMLNGPATAAVPVLKKYLGRLIALAGPPAKQTDSFASAKKAERAKMSPGGSTP
jgi:hypothetical protein